MFIVWYIITGRFCDAVGRNLFNDETEVIEMFQEI